MSEATVPSESCPRPACAQAAALLEAYEATTSSGRTPDVSLFDSAAMKRFGRHLVLLEWFGEEDLRVLHAGSDIPAEAPAGAGAPVSAFGAAFSSFYIDGARAVRGKDHPVLRQLRTPLGSAVHRWEGLFLPLAESGGGERKLVAVYCAALEQKHSFLRGILDAMPAAALVVEPAGAGAPMAVATVVAANAAALRIFGHASLEALINLPLASCFAMPDSDDSWVKLVADMQPGMTTRFDFNYRCGARAEWYDISLCPLDGAMMLTLTDISDLKHAILELDYQRKTLLEEMEQRRTLEEELWALAHLDPLTGLPNRRAFREDAQTCIVSSQTLRRPCAAISIDIDHFKLVNDSYGHGVGDLVLRRVADVLKAPLRPEVDIAARMGGEEFAVLLTDTELEGARAFAEMLRHRIEHTVVIAGDAEIRPTISLGVAMVRPNADLDDLLDRSDRALYAAKRTGRNRVVIEGEVEEQEAQQAA